MRGFLVPAILGLAFFAGFSAPTVGSDRPKAGDYRARLAEKVSWDTATATPAYEKEWHGWTAHQAVRAIAAKVGVPFQGPRSWEATKPECFRYIGDFKAKHITAREAMLQVLDAVGLTYEVDDNGVYLMRQPKSVLAAKAAKAAAKPKEEAGKYVLKWQSKTVGYYFPSLDVQGTITNLTKEEVSRAEIIVQVWERRPFTVVRAGEVPDALVVEQYVTVWLLGVGQTEAWDVSLELPGSRSNAGQLKETEYLVVKLGNVAK